MICAPTDSRAKPNWHTLTFQNSKTRSITEFSFFLPFFLLFFSHYFTKLLNFSRLTTVLFRGAILACFELFYVDKFNKDELPLMPEKKSVEYDFHSFLSFLLFSFLFSNFLLKKEMFLILQEHPVSEISQYSKDLPDFRRDCRRRRANNWRIVHDIAHLEILPQSATNWHQVVLTRPAALVHF